MIPLYPERRIIMMWLVENWFVLVAILAVAMVVAIAIYPGATPIY